jgi:hypothetical protein
MAKRALAAALVAGCLPWLPNGAQGASRGDELSTVSFRRDVAPVLVTSCSMASCHGAGLHPPEIDSDVDAASLRRALLAGASEERPDRVYVRAGDPGQSYLIDKVDGRLKDAECVDHDCGARMPARSPALSDRARGALAAWIAQGAKDD